MKPRNREINIFNMSLLDILCGALGAFCFMMIVLLPYYSSKPTNAPDVPKDLIDPKTLQEAQEQIKQLKEALEKMQNYAMGLEGQINQQKQQIAQQQQQIDELKKQAGKNNEYTGKLEMRNPFAGVAYFSQWNPEDKIQLWWDSDRVRSDQKAAFKLTPNDYEPQSFGGDLTRSSPALSYHVIRDCPPGQYRLVLKIIKHDPAKTPMRGFVEINTNDWFYVGPYLKISKQQVMIPIATIDMGPPPDYSYTFKWTFPPELGDEPDWKPAFPNRDKQGK